MNNVMPPEQLAEISKMLNQVKGQSGGQVKTATANSEEEQMLQIFNLLKFMQRLVSMHVLFSLSFKYVKARYLCINHKYV